MFPIASLAFVGGIMTGSFVGLVAHRVPRGSSIVGGRSVCDSCGVQIFVRGRQQKRTTHQDK